MLLRAAMVRRQLAQIFHGCQVPDQSTLELFSTIAASMQIRRTPQLRVTDAVESPALVGSWRPTVLVPSWMAAQSDRTALAWSLRHELTHWKHGDLWLIRLRELAQAIFFFHPAAWWAGRQLELAIEIACDRAVIATDAEAADYAQRLYQILEAVRDRRRPALASGLFATRSQIARRLVMLVETPLRMRPHLSKPAAFGMAALTAAVFTIGIGVRHETNAQDPSGTKPQPAIAQGDEKALPKVEKPESKPEPEIKVTDVEMLAGNEAGEMDLHFKVDAPAGRRFYLEYTHKKVRGAFAMTQVWESTGKVASIELKITYFPEFQGDRTVNVLESNAERLRCDINAKDCKGYLGLTTIISPPLLNTPADRRYLTLITSPSDWAAVVNVAGQKARRILFDCEKPAEGKKLEDQDPDKIEPRSEFIVGFYDEPVQPAWAAPVPRPAVPARPIGPDIRTAHIKYRVINTGSTTLAPLSSAEVKEVLVAADLEHHPEDFASVAAKLFLPEKAHDAVASAGEFFYSRGKHRENMPGWTHVVDEDWNLRESPQNHQIDVTPKGASRVASLNVGDFLGRGRAGTDKYGLKKYADGIEAPTLTVRTRFVDGKLGSLEMLFIDSAEFNEPVDEKEFALAAKAGTHVFIYRNNDPIAQPRFVPISSEVPDLVAFLLEKGDLNNDESNATAQSGPAAFRGIDLVVMKAAAKNNLNNGGLPEELGRTLSRVQGVKQVAGGLLDTVSFRDANLMGVLLYGISAHSPILERLKVQFGGRTLIAGDERKAIVGKGLAAKLGKQVGDKIELYGDEPFEIVGIYESPIQFENNGLVIPLQEQQRLMGRPGEVTGFTIVAEHPIDAKGLEDLRKRLEAVQPGLTATIAVEPNGDSKPTAGTDGTNHSDQPEKK